MKAHVALLLSGAFVVPVAWLQGQRSPAIVGYVTRAASNSDFDVNGFHVLCGPDTLSILYTSPNETSNNAGCPQFTPYLGERIRVYGSLKKKKKKTVRAAEVQALPAFSGPVHGSAVIEALLPQGGAEAVPGGFWVRADGYRILIAKETKTEWDRGLSSLADVKAGDWIDYKGRRDVTGAVTAVSVSIGPDVPTGGERKARDKEEFDPSAVPAGSKQDKVKSAFGEVDPKKFPPYKNAAMQARIEKIGNSLIPAYQSALPGSDPAKIHFRFQVIDTNQFTGALPLQSGVILIPRQTVERMQNDSQVAAILGASIAYILEYEAFRMRWTVPTTAAATFVALGALGAISGAALAEEDVVRRRWEGSERVSLDLMKNAGYDIDQAPVAWWLLSAKPHRPFAAAPLPEGVAYLYRILGEVWNNPAAAAENVR